MKYFKLSIVTLLLIGFSCLLQGCCQVSNDEDCNYRTVPVTNNPNYFGGGSSSQPGLPY